MPRRLPCRCLKGLVHELLDVLWGDPGGAQPHLNLTGLQVLGDGRSKGVHIGLVGGVILRRPLGLPELVADVAGQVLVGGLINSRGNRLAFSRDNSYYLLCSLEVLDDDGNLKRKADIFTKRTIQNRQPVTHVDTAQEALAVSIGERARVDLPYMAQLTGKDESTLISDLQGGRSAAVGGRPGGRPAPSAPRSAPGGSPGARPCP